MLTWRSGMALSAVLAVGLATLCWADAPAKGDDAKEKVLNSSEKDKQMQESAEAINFAKAFGLGFDSHETLGSRIQQARRAADPVALASEANELAVAEKISGKKASLTSSALLDEAEKLATLRANSSELKAVALLAPDETSRKKLNDLATTAQKREEAAADKVRSGERSRGITNNVRVVNHTHDRWTIYINGNYAGWVNPFGAYTFYVGDDPQAETVLEATADDGGHLQQNAESPRANYVWNLSE